MEKITRAAVVGTTASVCFVSQVQATGALLPHLLSALGAAPAEQVMHGACAENASLHRYWSVHSCRKHAANVCDAIEAPYPRRIATRH